MSKPSLNKLSGNDWAKAKQKLRNQSMKWQMIWLNYIQKEPN